MLPTSINSAKAWRSTVRMGKECIQTEPRVYRSHKTTQNKTDHGSMKDRVHISPADGGVQAHDGCMGNGNMRDDNIHIYTNSGMLAMRTTRLVQPRKCCTPFASPLSCSYCSHANPVRSHSLYTFPTTSLRSSLYMLAALSR